MDEIRRLTTLDAELLKRLIVGYTATAVYAVAKVETPELTRLEPQPLDPGAAHSGGAARAWLGAQAH